MPFFLGLDCGGTTCRAMAIDQEGTPVFLAQGGSGNVATGGADGLRRSLERALTGAPAVDTVCACFAGLVTPDQEMALQNLVTSLVDARRVIIQPDYAAALRACPEGTTVCVTAGTGSVVCSRTPDGLLKSGGGGYLLGDEGSGYRFGRAALAHYIRDPENASLAFRTTLGRYFEDPSPGAVIRAVYAARSPAPLIATFAPAFAKDVREGVPYACVTLTEEMTSLASLVRSHILAHHAGTIAPAVGLAGGLWKRAVFCVGFQDALARALPGAIVRKSESPPVRGAALLALESA